MTEDRGHTELRCTLVSNHTYFQICTTTERLHNVLVTAKFKIALKCMKGFGNFAIIKQHQRFKNFINCFQLQD